MKVFVVGIAGGIGSRLARLLTASGDQVDGLYRRPEQGQELETHGIHATHGDLTRLDAPALAAFLHGADVLVFTAGAGGEGGATATTAIDGSLAELVHTPRIHHQILELTQGPEPITDAVHRQTHS
ncbi:hypothetical protein GCM10022254_17030 [Actinomadura meridiana]|uniref:NAD(P)-binding domain-containing protein n=1 Tax=Actinomadura meridiana TaxID=559626 RepID=A0ABP8BVV7_9ACTN